MSTEQSERMRLAEVAAEARAYGYVTFADVMDDAADEIERLRAQLRADEAEIAELRAEVERQARLNGMGAERELALLSRAERAESELAALRERVAKAPVADIAEDGKHNGESSLLSAAIKAGYYQGKRVRLLIDDEQEGKS